ncbi:GHKL domain-containing protein [Lysobacter arenosi]|uniref:histidine kinase n=1 Tax=Lysobacter arenosi TaxID=2795387 RepID=A0ABX7R8X2_9GAMM|nr:ATP-binding protein [Lysobacter arenosi]QSX73819.1 GHKL domain-containing protein [Lysobacter arenosi]
MNWIELAWPMLASASLIVALAHALVHFARPLHRVHLAFALAAASIGVLALLELVTYRTQSPETMAVLIRWMHVAITAMVLSLIYVLHHWFGYGSVRIAIAAAVLRVIALVIDFTVGDNLTFLVVEQVGRSIWWGVPVSHPIGMANPWVIVGQASNALALAYIGQTIWRARNEPASARNAAWIVGGSWFLLVGVMVADATLMAFGLPRPPMIAAPGFAIVVVTTSYRLVSELFRSDRLAMQLQESELRRLRSEQEVEAERASLAHLSRVAVLGELSGSLAHELNQPLTAILSNAQAAQRILRREPTGVAEVQEILSDIIADDRRAGQVIGRVRGFLRKETHEFAPLSANEVVQDCARMMRRELQDRGVALHLDLAPGLPACLGDRVQLQQVLVNLIVNACDAMHAVPGERTVRVRTSSNERSVLAEVADTGTGVAEAIVDQIFEPFETTKATGMGLGLSVCRTIIQAHNGRIWAERNMPVGACLCFELPRYG